MAMQPSPGRYGIWSAALQVPDPADPARHADIIEAVQELEQLGYGTLWIGGSSDISHAAALIDTTSTVTVATGILSIWQHDAGDVAARHTALTTAHPGRFLLGLGASHAKLAGDYHRPYSTMVAYLDALDAAPTPVPAGERVLAALGPKMLELARDRAAGAHPYLINVEHTASARTLLGPDALLAPEVKVVLDSDPDRARMIARGHLAYYLALPNYTNNLLRLGFTTEDFANGGSDRLVDSVVAWGDEAAVRRRIDAFLAAGADHLAFQILQEPGEPGLPRHGWRRLAEIAELAAA